LATDDDMKPPAARRALAYLHFGDLHVTTEERQNYRDFVALIADANERLRGDVDFAVLPGDNADDGTIPEYRLIGKAIDRLKIPLELRTGDHDRASGSLENYRSTLEPTLYRSRAINGYRCVFVNSLDGSRKDEITMGPAQLEWLRSTFAAARRAAEPILLFTHAYPSEFGRAADELISLVATHRVPLVDMGHTHYNELANDGRTIYAATRSTGQIEEGPVGFSLTSIDDGVVSWRFEALEARWPFVLITSPADRRLISDSERHDHVVRGCVDIRARVWGARSEPTVHVAIDDQSPKRMSCGSAPAEWIASIDASGLADGIHRVSVSAADREARDADVIDMLVDRAGRYDRANAPPRDKDAAIGAYEAKGILGTRLGPNENGHPW